MHAVISPFVDSFPGIVEEIIQEIQNSMNMPEDALKWIRELMEYNIPGGKMNRGLAVVESVAIFKGGLESLSAADHKASIILGWCIEILQACFLIADDIMDSSTMRRSKPCWYKQTGLAAINDSMILQSVVYRLLARHFKEQPCYVNLVDLFLEVTYKTELGQLLDLITAPTGKPDLEKFSPLRYQQIVQYKTSFYSFYLPVALAMIYCGVDGKELLGEARKCLIPLGEFFQIQDDFLDCFGDSKILGKIGTDIDEGKCSWLAMKFMEIASDAELKVFKEIYSTPGSTAVISKMYKEAELDQEYERLQEATKKTLNETLLTISDPKLVLIIESFAKKIFNRQK